MSDQDNRSEDNVPEGMVRKTRRVRKKRRSSGGHSDTEKDANSLFAKAKDLLVGMQEEESDDYGPVDVAEQVRRLKNRKNDDGKPLDDVWGTKKRSASWLWIILIGIIVPVVGIVVAVTVLADKSGYESGMMDEKDIANVQETKFDPGEGPTGWYSANSVEVIDEVTSIIHQINEAGSAEEIAPLLRSSPYRELYPVSLEDWGKPLLTTAFSYFRWETVNVFTPGLKDSTERGVLTVRGTRIDREPFQAYFVHEDGKVVLDWDATTGWSEMTVGELAEKQPRKGTMVRCLYEKKPSFDQKFGEVEYSGYVISSPDLNDYLLAYLPLNNERNKEMDRALRRALDYGSFINKDRPPLKNQRVTLSVRRGNDTGDNGIFEITGYLHADWVRP